MTTDLERADSRFAPVDSSRTFNNILDLLDLRSKKVLDIGCGYGEYLVKFGKNSVGLTTTPAEVEYGKTRNIKIISGNVELIDKLGIQEKFEAMWANNLFEHLLAPHAFLIKAKTIATPNAVIILGVPVIPRIASLMKLQFFRGALAMAHVNFFTRESLWLSVDRAGWNVKDVRPFFFKNRFLDMLASFFAPHLYVVAYNNPEFKYHDKKLKEWIDDAHYESILKIVGQK